jgi:hypothetical protein
MLQSRVAWAGWLLMPGEMLLVEQYMRRERVDFATAFSRHTDYLFTDIQTQLAKKWGLPDLYSDFLHGHNAVRGQGVVLALKLAEVACYGWWQPQVEKTIEHIAEWLHQPVDDITAKVHVFSVQAAHQSENWYGKATPAAAWLPMLPGQWPDDPLQVALTPAARINAEPLPAVAVKPATQAQQSAAVVTVKSKPEMTPPQASKITDVMVTPEPRQAEKNTAHTDVKLTAPAVVAAGHEQVKHVLHPEVVNQIIADIKSHMDGSYDISQLMSRVLTAMHDGLAMDRVVFALMSADQTIKARFTRGIEDGAPLNRLNFSLLEKHLFAQLMGKMQAVWYRDATQQKLSPLLLPKLRAQIGRGEFMAMSVFVHDKPLGFFYVDYGDKGQMDDNVYNGFKQLCTLTAEGMAHLAKKSKG